MKLDAQEIEQLVGETESKRSEWATAADVWEADWYGSRYEDTRENKRELDGVDTVVSPDPFNVVQLLLRFVAGEQRVEVPSLSTKEDDEDRSEIMEEWLVAFDQESNRQQGRNHINDMTVQSGVLARGITQVLWVGDKHKELNITGRLPILRRHLDPRNCGIGRGAFGVDYGYHKYDATHSYVSQMYPKYKFKDSAKVTHHVTNLTKEKYTVIDYYHREKGSIWHTVVINGEYAKPPKKTDYIDVPFVEHFADGGPFDSELGRSLSILHPIHELWKMKCDLLSKVATGLMYHYDPLVLLKNIPEDKSLYLGPGANIFLKENQSIDMFRPEPNVPMAQALLSMIQTSIDQATFPGVTYGDAPGGVNAGFAINNLSQQARSRVNVIRQNIETGMEAVNQQILSMVEMFMPDEGVEIYGRSGRGDRGRPLKLTKKIIKGNYANQVMLLPEQPMDDTQRILAWQGLVDKGIVSKELMRNRVVNIQLPRDEEARVALEGALTMPEMAQKNTLRALQARYKDQDELEVMIHGTPLEAVWEAEKQFIEQRKARKEMEKEQRKQEKEQARLEELLAQGKAHRMPDGTIMEGEMMLPPGMPPSPFGPPPSPNGMPPPPSGQPMMPPPGAMSGLEGPPPMPPEGMQPPGMPGMPPSMAGQFDQNALGLGGMPPGTMDQLLGGAPPSDEEMLRKLSGGMPPQG